MPHNNDNTLKDLNRRNLAFGKYSVKEILPEFFREEYPKLITLLDEYYHFEKSEESPSKLVDELFLSRDITQNDLDLLTFIEDELLLGQSFFEGFQDKRAASKYSNVLFRSKGTKYSIQQFFRTFFGIDPDIVYTKEQVFNVGDDIGVDSQKFITNNKLYQKHAILIKSGLEESKWKDAYKLFVHPAGTFLGSEIQIVSSVVDTLTAPEVVIEPPPPFAVHSSASFASVATTDHTSLVDDFNTDNGAVNSASVATTGTGHINGDDYNTTGGSGTGFSIRSTSSGGLVSFTIVNRGSGYTVGDVVSTVIADPATITIDSASSGILSRIRPELVNPSEFSTFTVQEINNQYGSLREAQVATSPTFDDSDQVGTNGMDFSNNFSFETLDQDRHVFYSSDSDQYLLNLGHLG